MFPTSPGPGLLIILEEILERYFADPKSGDTGVLVLDTNYLKLGLLCMLTSAYTSFEKEEFVCYKLT